MGIHRGFQRVSTGVLPSLGFLFKVPERDLGFRV